MKHRVSGKWIGAARNNGDVQRLYDVFVDGIRISDVPVTRGQVAREARASIAAVRRANSVTLRWTARNRCTAKTAEGFQLTITRRRVSKAERQASGCHWRTVYTPSVDGCIGDLFSNLRAAEEYLSAWWTTESAAKAA
jgi:hypothetical protein